MISIVLMRMGESPAFIGSRSDLSNDAHYKGTHESKAFGRCHLVGGLVEPKNPDGRKLLGVIMDSRKRDNANIYNSNERVFVRV